MTKRLQLIRLAILLAALVAGTAAAENSKVSYPPVPAWVQEVEWTAPTNGLPSEKSAGMRYLVYECQDRPKRAESFVRVVESMENDTGVQNSGSLRFSFDPQYQELCLHRVVIHRAGKTIDRLNPAQVRIIQPEPDLDGHVFSGRQTAVLFVEDLRVGDVLEYAYTIRGENPVFAGHYASRFFIQFGSPVDRELFRVVWDDNTPLHQRLYRTDRPADIQTHAGRIEYAWSSTNAAAIPDEDLQPISYQPFPAVEVSDFADWQSVVDWALPLYDASPTNLPPEMRDLIAKWQSPPATEEEKARWALEFVQDNPRYTGIELGPDSYRPADPVETFVKRYGDCKGKTVLLHFLLQQMNIESYPALVSASEHEAIGDRLPSPFAFDHAILQIKLFKRTLWVDPTSSHQGGLLWHRHVSNFGKALVLRPGNDALEDMSGNEGGEWDGYFSAQIWQTVAMPQGAGYHPLYGPLLVFEMLGHIFLLGLNLLALCLFFAKRATFPIVFIALVIGSALFLLLDNAGCLLIPSLRSAAFGKDDTAIVSAILGAVLWTSYTLKSRRVKATFTR